MRWTVLGLVGLGFLAVGCASTPKGDAVAAELLTYDSKLGEQALDHAKIDLPWELHNPTLYTVTVDAAQWVVEINGVQVAVGLAKLGASAPAGQTIKGTLEIDTPLTEIVASLDNSAEQSILRYNATATFQIAAGPDGLTDYEADWHGEFFAPRKPSVEVTGQAGRYGDGSVELNFVVSINNGNPFGMHVDHLNYTLFIEDVEVSTGTLASGQRLNAASELQFNVARTIGRKEIPGLSKTLLKAKTIPYRLESKLVAGGVEVQTPVTGTIEFSHD